jgi:hypothetical protein
LQQANLPTLVWGVESQEIGIDANSSGRRVSFFVRPGPFLRPDLDPAGAPRAAAVKAGRRCAWAASSILARPRLDCGEHGARLEDRDDWSRDERRDVILDWAVSEECGISA